MEPLKDKVAVVTGAASGIGLAVSRKAAAEGMAVVMADVEDTALDKAASELEAEGARVLALPTDVSQGPEMARLRTQATERFGAVHLVHLNAGINAGGALWEVPEADWRWVLGVNLWGVVHGISAFVPALVEQGEGHVVITGSLAGLVTGPFMGPYNATKHAVVAIAETLLKDLHVMGSGVGVSVLCPGWVRTNIADSERNRPEWAPARASEPARRLEELGRQMIATGMDPAEVADAVLDAVRTNRFYIITHPEMTVPAVTSRLHDIVEGRTPKDLPLP